MKNSLITIGVIIFIVIGYIVVANFMAERIFEDAQGSFIQGEQQQSRGNIIKMGVGDEVDIKIRRVRWYGVIDEIHSGSRNINYLYIFNKVRIPINVNGSNWAVANLIILAFLIWFILILFGIKIYLALNGFERRYKESALDY